MNKNVITFDVDGCLADFEGYFCDVFGFENREQVDLLKRYPKYAREIEDFIENPRVYQDLAPIKLGLDICKWLSDNGFEVAIVSSRPVGTLRLTMAWLKKYDVKYTSISVTHFIPKIARVKQISPLLHVDDMWGVAREMDKAFIDPVLIAQPWNARRLIEFPRVSTLGEFIKTLKIIYDWRTR